MDIGISEIIFSGIFILLGSVVFQISTLLSGYNLYKEHNLIESSYLSIVGGILVFLLSPISYITLLTSKNSQFVNGFVQLFNKCVILSFLSCAIGIGLIVGSLIIIDARTNILCFIREHSSMPFWIYSSSEVWDYCIDSIKSNGEITILTNTLGSLEGLLIASSIRTQPRELLIETRDNHSRIFIRDDEIRSIEIPQNSFKKHYEPISHIGQAFYCIIISIGLFLLAYNASAVLEYINYLGSNDMTKYISYSDLQQLQHIIPFYEQFKFYGLLSSVLVLMITIGVAKQDFRSWRAYLRIYPNYLLIFIAVSAIFYNIIYSLDISFTIVQPFRFDGWIVVFAVCGTCAMWYYIAKKRISNDIIKIISNINEPVLLDRVVTSFNMKLCLNDKSKCYIKKSRMTFI